MKSGSRLERTFAEGKFAVTAEIFPPRTPSVRLLHKRAEQVRDYLTAANLTDNQSATVRIASMAASRIVLDAGVEPVMQITCRDRNRMAIQADVIGAAALGIKNILCVTGDHQKFGDHPAARNVYDLDSMNLIQMLKTMRDDGRFHNGDAIRNRSASPVVPPEIFIGAAANPFGSPRHFRPYRLAKKIAAGADFVQTQPVYDLVVFREWLQKAGDLGLIEKVHIMAGITPVKSVDALCYMRDHVPGMHIPEATIRRMTGAADPEREGFEMALEMICAVKDLCGVRGIHLMAIGWEKVVPLLIEAANIVPEPVAVHRGDRPDAEIAGKD
ncbi:methylenetetrahydrofolate reductase [bacterium]|nr:methylenetetrahydrofolate reductase [candidate division CSSED10-310 bacterium]